MSQLDDSVLDPVGAAAQAAPARITETKPEIYAVVAEFETTKALLGAIETLRAKGYRMEAYTPFPVHGIDEALGLRRSHLGWVVLGMGLAGAGAALLLQWWTGAVDYPLVIAGKPYFALEFATPITFELTVLFASFGAVLGMFLFNGLPRFYHPAMNHPRFAGATDDKFLLAVESTGEGLDVAEAMKELEAAGGAKVEVVPA